MIRRVDHRVAIYAHFDANAVVARHVIFYLEQIRELGFQVIFVSNSPISSTDRERLGSVSVRIIERDNSGLDFCMWKEGLEETDLASIAELLLVNSSMIGPLRKLAQLWDRSQVAHCDFWGLTDNWEPAPHLQSYFLVFRASALRANCFREFWNSVLPYQSKMQIVRSYEVGLTLWLQEHGLKWRAIFPQEKICHEAHARLPAGKRLKRMVRPRSILSDTTHFHVHALVECGFPFIKGSLFRTGNRRLDPQEALNLCHGTILPTEVMFELQTLTSPTRG